MRRENASSILPTRPTEQKNNQTSNVQTYQNIKKINKRISTMVQIGRYDASYLLAKAEELVAEKTRSSRILDPEEEARVPKFGPNGKQSKQQFM